MREELWLIAYDSVRSGAVNPAAMRTQAFLRVMMCIAAGLGEGLLVAEGVDGVESGGAACGHEAEEDADGGGEGEGDDVDFGIEEEGCADDIGEDFAKDVGEADAGDAADAGEGDGFDEELEEDFAGACADGEADADFAGALGDGDEHDVHDADAADEEADAGDRA